SHGHKFRKDKVAFNGLVELDGAPKRLTVEQMHMAGEKISEDIQTLAIGPLIPAKRMTGYICDGVRYLTESRDVKRKSQNSGIMLKAITQSYASTKDKNPILAELSDEPFIFASQAKQVFYVDHPMEKEWRMVVKLKPRGFYDLGDDTPTIEHKEGHMELWPEQQLDDTTFETEEDIEWVREGVPGLEIDPETLESNEAYDEDDNIS
ncbi:hypothetical protein MTR67_001500, partial [Solanum verrucosum]